MDGKQEQWEGGEWQVLEKVFNIRVKFVIEEKKANRNSRVELSCIVLFPERSWQFNNQ